MAGTWSSARRLALPRATADLGLLAVVATTVLVAVVFFVAGPLYASAVSQAGIQERLRTAGPHEAGIDVRGLMRPQDVDAAHELLVATLAPLGADRVNLDRTTRAPSALAPFLDPVDEVLVVTEAERLDERVVAVTGRLPEGVDGQTIEVVLHADEADRLGVQAGAEVPATVKAGGAAIPLRVVGTYRARPAPVGGPLHDQDPLVADGSEHGGSFTSIAALTQPDALTAGGVTDRVSVTWRARLQPEQVTPDDLGALRSELARTQRDLAGLPRVAAVRTGLPDLLASAQASLGVTAEAVRSTTLVLSLLALTSLVLAARVLLELRETGSALLRARGASAAQLATAAALEATLLVLPALLLAPPLAALVVSMADVAGAVAAAEIQLEATADATAYRSAAVAALASWAALALPAVAASRTYVDVQRRRGRRGAQGWFQRWQLDMALGALAGLALWQLHQAVSRGSASAGSGADPAIVFAPPLAIIAGGLLALRTVPALGRAVSAATRRASGRLGSRLAGAQVERRSPRYRTPVLVTVLAGTLAVYAAVYAATWSSLQGDRATARTGADLRVEPARDEPLAPTDRRDAHAGTPGVEAVTPVHRHSFNPARGARGVLIGLGADRADTVILRPDLVAGSDQSPDDLLRALDASPAVPHLDLPPGTTDLVVTASAFGDVAAPVLLRVITQDASGLLRRESHPLPLDRARHELTFAVGRTDGRPPGRLLAIEVATTAPTVATTEAAQRAEVTLHRVATATARDDLAPSGVEWDVNEVQLRRTAVAPSSALVVREGVHLSLGTGVSGEVPQPVVWRLTPGAVPGDGPPLPAILTTDAARALGVAPGEHATIAQPGGDLEVSVLATVARVPGAADEAVAVAVDGAALATHRYLATGEVAAPDLWLLATDEARDDEVAATIAATPGEGRQVVQRTAVAAQLRRDPVRLGLSGSLELAGIAALVLAGLAALTGTRVDARRRRSEFAFLRAIGTPARTITRWLVVESTVTTGAALAVALTLGIGLVTLVRPSIGLATGGRWAPDTLLVVPWATVTALVGLGVALVLVPPVVVSRRLAHEDVAELIRAGEDA